MTKTFAIVAIAAAFAAGAGIPAFAQSVPEGQSCGGLLCDMGVFGHKTQPRPPAPPPVHAEATPAAVAAEPADPEPKPKTVRKKKHVAKAAARDTSVPGKANASQAEARPVSTVSVPKASTAKATVAKGPAPVVRPPVPFGWESAVTQPPVAPAEPAAAPVAQAQPKPADSGTSVNVINLYSALPSAGIRPLY